MKRTIMVIGLAFVFGFVIAGRQEAAQQSTQTTAPKVTVGAALKAKANNPVPGPTAKQQSKKTSIGKGKVAVTASQASSFWTEQVDANDNGVAKTLDFLYDAPRGVLYSYREDDFACQNGQTVYGGILQALYGSGNKAGAPAGSGWYAMTLDNAACGAKRSGMYGCRFDTNGSPTSCGAVTINNATGDITVAQVE